jgi:hypothetical protein
MVLQFNARHSTEVDVEKGAKRFVELPSIYNGFLRRAKWQSVVAKQVQQPR